MEGTRTRFKTEWPSINWRDLIRFTISTDPRWTFLRKKVDELKFERDQFAKIFKFFVLVELPIVSTVRLLYFGNL